MDIPNRLTAQKKRDLCMLLASNLPTLRTKANLSQNELADRLGFSRQTINAIEGRKREMQWSTFSVFLMFFARNIEIRRLLIAMGILDDDVEMNFTIDLGKTDGRNVLAYLSDEDEDAAW